MRLSLQRLVAGRHPGTRWDRARRTSRPAASAASPRWLDVRSWWLAIAALLALLATPAFAQTFPAFTGLVVDAANVLPASSRTDLEARLENLQQTTRHQFAVVTVQSLHGRSIEDYSIALARRWGVGRKHYDDGVMMLVAPKERKVRIEVGRGLEATLTDPRCAEIIRSAMLPRFRHGDLPGGIAAGVDRVASRLRAAAPLEGGAAL